MLKYINLLIFVLIVIALSFVFYLKYDYSEQYNKLLFNIFSEYSKIEKQYSDTLSEEQKYDLVKNLPFYLTGRELKLYLIINKKNKLEDFSYEELLSKAISIRVKNTVSSDVIEYLEKKKNLLSSYISDIKKIYIPLILCITSIYFIYLFLLFLYFTRLYNKGYLITSFKSQRIGIVLSICSVILVIFSFCICDGKFHPINDIGEFYSSLFLFGFFTLIISICLIFNVVQPIFYWINGEK